MLDHDEEETYMDDYRNTVDKDGFQFDVIMNLDLTNKFWNPWKLINMSVDPQNKKSKQLLMFYFGITSDPRQLMDWSLESAVRGSLNL